MPIDSFNPQLAPAGSEAGPDPTSQPRRVTAPPFEPVGSQEEPSPAPAATATPPTETATLQFVGGVSNLVISVDPMLTHRYAARFEGPQPEVTEFGNQITIRYPCSPFAWGRTEAEVRLRPDVAWTLRLRGGASRADIDVRDLDLRGFDISGGVSRMDLALGDVHGTVSVRVHGGVSRVDITRPHAVPAQLEVNGGASRLSLDDQMLGAIGGATRLQSGGFESAQDRLQVEVRGGASRLSVARR